MFPIMNSLWHLMSYQNDIVKIEEERTVNRGINEIERGKCRLDILKTSRRNISVDNKKKIKGIYTL